jgi:DNA polymerase III subunit epsilon
MTRILAIDFETANYSPSSACQIGVVRIEDWRIVDSKAWLIRPPSDDFVFTYLHGISWDDVGDQPQWAGLWPELLPWFEGVDYLAAHNAPFDRGVLRATCAEQGIIAPQTPFLDTVSVARQVWKIFPTKLNLVCQKLGIELQHHEALSDARACAQILIRARAEGWEP